MGWGTAIQAVAFSSASTRKFHFYLDNLFEATRKQSLVLAAMRL